MPDAYQQRYWHRQVVRHRQVSLRVSEKWVDGWFICPTRWHRQHDHRKLL